VAEEDFAEDVARIATLNDPVRRSLYRYVAGRGGDVDRGEAARALGISRSLATFHLERLAKQGLLDTTFRRLTGRAGPGAGRPAKLYRRSARSFQLSVPSRDYELAARAMAQAINHEGTTQAGRRLRGIAREVGARWASTSTRRVSKRSAFRRLLRILEDHGYEPYFEGRSDIRLRNCPFVGLVDHHEEVVCRALNVGLIQGLVAALGEQRGIARYDPRPPLCCVAIEAPSRR
jgi:predicted ArsR family transcriptional regulator